MITATLLAAAVLGPSPVQFEIKLSNSIAKPGETIRVDLIAKNTATKPIVIAKAIWDGAPAAGASAKLENKGIDLRFIGDSSMPSAQVMVSNKIDKERFITLGPGDSTVVYWTNIESYYDFPADVKGRAKADYAKATVRALPPGTYQCTLSYEFDRDAIARQFRQEWRMGIQFGPGAEAAWNSAVNTRFTGKRTFVIR